MPQNRDTKIHILGVCKSDATRQRHQTHHFWREDLFVPNMSSANRRSRLSTAVALLSMAYVFSDATGTAFITPPPPAAWRQLSRSSDNLPHVVEVLVAGTPNPWRYNMWPTYKSNLEGDDGESNKKNNSNNSSNGNKVESIDTKETIQEKYDVERFRNRAALTQSVLKEKVEEVKLLKSKVMVLQNVVQRLRTDSERELEKQRSNSQEKLNASAEVLESLRGEFNKTKQLLEDQAQQQSKVIQSLEADLAQQKLDLSAKVDVERNKNRKLGDQIKALQKEVLDMDQTLETTQGELQKMQRRLVAREDEIRSQAESQERKRNSLESKIQELEKELENAVASATKAEELRQESIQIATAAVEAATQREIALKSELEVLNVKVSTLQQQEKDVLQSQLRDGRADSHLLDKISKLENALIEERLANDIRRNVEQEQLEMRQQTERKLYQEELNRLRTRVNQQRGNAPPTAISGRLRQLWLRLRS